jgi:PIN domain nuclease of toxin-antitoxin system
MEARQAFLDEFVENRGGAYGGRVDTPAAQALQAEVEAARSRLRTPTIPKKLGLGDAQVAQAARTEGAPIVTSDKKMADTLSLLKDFVVELFQ